MLRNYLTIGLRQLWRNPLFSFVNIAGLGLSMAIGVLLVIDLKKTFDTDHFHPHLARTYRLLTTATDRTGATSQWASSPEPLSDVLRQSATVEKVVSVRAGDLVNALVKGGEVPVRTAFTDPRFFDVFEFTLQSGTAQTLEKPNAVLLSAPIAQRLFGDQNPVGQLLELENWGTFTVGGIIAQPPLPSHIQPEVLLSARAVQPLERRGVLKSVSDDWQDYQSVTLYALLREAANGGEAALNGALKNVARPPKTAGPKLAFSAQPLEDITPWNPAIRNDLYAGANWQGIGLRLFLLLALTALAAFNYISLSLARGLSRAQEVGIRKAAGALRRQLFGQFLVESLLIAFLALGVAGFLLVAVRDMSPFDAVLTQSRWHYPLAGWLLVYTGLTGVMAGLVPAWLLSAFQPVQVLRRLQNVRLLRRVSLYKVLIGVQFAVTTMLTVFLVILRDAGQAQQHRDLGFPTDGLLVMDLKGQPLDRIQPQLEALSQLDGLSAVSALPGLAYPTGRCQVSLRRGEAPRPMIYSAVDARFVATLGLRLLAGPGFSAQLPTHSESQVLLNESAARQLAPKPATLVGQTIQIDSVALQVAGIVPDAVLVTLPAEPVLFRYRSSEFRTLVLRAKPHALAALQTAARQIWHQQFPKKVPAIDTYRARFAAASDSRNVYAFFGFFTGLVLVVACLGMLGMAAYAVGLRTREVGIRRTLGATSTELVWAVSKGFGKLLLWAAIPGLPAGWFCGLLLRNRMGNVVQLGPANLMMGLGLVLLAGGLTVLSQTYRASRVNPADVLRGE